MKHKSPLVIIDARMVTNIGHGIGNYVEDLAQGLLALNEKEPFPYEILFLTNPELNSTSAIHNFSKQQNTISFLHPLESILLPQVLKRLKPSVFHSPSFSSLTYYPCPHILTIHDLNHLRFGSMSQKIYYKTLVKHAIKIAAKIFTVSDFSKKEIESWLPGLPIQIAKNAIKAWPEISSEEEKVILKKFGLRAKEFFFTLSNPKPHKNLTFLKKAYQQYQKEKLTAKESPFPLVLSTQGNSVEGILHIGELPTKEIITLIKNCSGFYFPSLYEGFGRPPLEAALLGAAIIASNIPAHEEGLSIFATHEKTLLSPIDQDAWAKAFHQAQNKKLPYPPKDAKEKIFVAYSSETLAKTMDKAYREILHTAR